MSSNYNESEFKEYESILKKCVVNKDVDNGLKEALESLSATLSYQKFLSLVGSNDTYKEFRLKNGSSIKIISTAGIINIAQKTSNGEIINLVLSKLSGKETSEQLFEIAKKVKNK